MAVSILYSMAVLFGLWGIYSYLGYRTSKREWGQRVGKWSEQRDGRKSFIVVWGDKFDKTPFAARMKRKLQAANLPLKPSEFYGMLILGTLVAALLMKNLFSIGMPYNVMIALLGMEAVKRALFFIRRNKYQERLNDQLPEVCRLLGNATRAGMTVTQGIELAARELPFPANEEFKKLAHEIRLGVDFERALLAMQDRIASREFKLFIATLLVQKRAGGNLYEILDEMAQTLEERKILNQTIKTMTAEQRYIAYILPMVPILMILLMNSVIEGFIQPLFTPIGVILLILFLIGTGLTFLLVRAVTNIRV